MSKSKTVDPTESGQEKFRRVFAQRIKSFDRYANMLKNMALQPHYDISSDDAKKVLNAIDGIVKPLISNYERARDGDIKAKELKELTSIDWDAELLDDDENENTDESGA